MIKRVSVRKGISVAKSHIWHLENNRRLFLLSYSAAGFLYCTITVRMIKRFLLYITFLCLCALPANAQSELFRAQQELIGSKLIELTFTDWLQNQPTDTSFKGKYKVLEFWATWCKPCLEAVPHMNKLQSRFADSNIVFLSVTHQTREETAKTLGKHKFETIVVSDRTRRVHEMLRISYMGTMGLPRTVILDGDNNIRWYGNPKSLTEKMIKKLLTE